MKSDLQPLGINDGCWCALAKDRRQWQELYLQCTDDQQGYIRVKVVICSPCGRCFRRESDKAHHKCIAEQERPIKEQFDVVQCQKCECWFHSEGA